MNPSSAEAWVTNDRLRVARQATLGNSDTVCLEKTNEKERRKASEEAAGTAEGETHSHKGG